MRSESDNPDSKRLHDERVDDASFSRPLNDIAFVVDLSESMRPCIDLLLAHLDLLASSLQREPRTRCRFAVVGHKSPRRSPPMIFVRDFTPDLNATRSALSQLHALAGRTDEASIHAMDWAMDCLSWDLTYARRFITVFTNERICRGCMEGVSGETAGQFTEKLLRFSYFLAAPVVADAEPMIGWKGLAQLGACRGWQDIPTISAKHWTQVDFRQLIDRLTASIHGSQFLHGAIPAASDVFGVRQDTRVTQL